MKNEATIMITNICKETDDEIMEIAKTIISLSKYMDITLKINAVKNETEYGKVICTGPVISELDPHIAEYSDMTSSKAAIEGVVSTYSTEISDWIADQIKG